MAPSSMCPSFYPGRSSPLLLPLLAEARILIRESFLRLRREHPDQVIKQGAVAGLDLSVSRQVHLVGSGLGPTRIGPPLQGQKVGPGPGLPTMRITAETAAGPLMPDGPGRGHPHPLDEAAIDMKAKPVTKITDGAAVGTVTAATIAGIVAVAGVAVAAAAAVAVAAK